jgi:putative ABC transport system permease protein
MDTLSKHLAVALRVLRRSPVFTVTAMLTLALGIGATTAIFSVANTVLLRTLPYPDADRLVLVWSELRARSLRDFPIAPGDFPDLREQATHFEELAAVIPARQPLLNEGLEPEQVRVAGVTTNLLPMLGAKVIAGRGFVADDARPQPAPPQGAGAPGPAAGPPPAPLPQMVVLSHGLWQRRFGGDPGIVGRRIDLGFGGSEVVGVLAPGFELLWPPGTGVDVAPDVFTAARINFDDASRINVSLRIVGRLKPGVSAALATEQLERIAAGFREQFPIKKTADLHMYAERMHDDLVADVRPAIVTLLGAVGFVLLIACANVANLLLVRAAARERELAVRAALGGSPGKLMLPLLAEVFLLALGGALLGLLLAYGGIRLLAAVAPPDLPRLNEVGIDPMVLGFTMLVTIVAALVFGLVPSLRASRPDLADALRAGRTPGLATGKLLRQGVVVAEVALAFVLLAGGGLMVRSFVALQNSPPGFDPSNVLTFQAGLQSPDAPARAAFLRQLAERLGALPEVRSVTAAYPLPLSGETANARWGTQDAASDPAKFQQANVRAVLPGYFQAMRTRLLAGRAFTDADNQEDRTGIVIDRVLAEKAFPNQSAVGQRLLVRARTNEPELLEVIGVVEHQRHETLVEDGRETIYVTDAFLGTGAATRWAVRTAGDPAQLAPTVRRVVAELDARTPIAEMQPMEVLVSRAMAPTRFALVLIGVFAGVAALLACVGLYGVLATAVRQRTTELGVRLALGAPTSSIFRLVVREGLALSAIGIAVGLVAALPLTGVMRTLLVGVGATDPPTFVAVALLFLAIAAVASWVPGRRAARLDPTHALRGD